MKSYHSDGGRLVEGTSLLEDLLQSRRKTESLLAALKEMRLKVFSAADPKHKNIDWIVPEEF